MNTATVGYPLGIRTDIAYVSLLPKRYKLPQQFSGPNREDAPRYIVRLIGKVITVSLETVDIVEGVPNLGVPSYSNTH